MSSNMQAEEPDMLFEDSSRPATSMLHPPAAGPHAVYEAHIALAKKIEGLVRKQTSFHNFRLTNVGLAALMQMPTSRLRGIVRLLEPRGHDSENPEVYGLTGFYKEAVVLVLRDIHFATHYFFADDEEAGFGVGASAKSPCLSPVFRPNRSPRENYEDAEVPRSEAERKKCLDRDHNRSIVTESTGLVVCHIVPFSWSKSRANQASASKHLQTLRLFFSNSRYEQLMRDLGDSLGFLDKRWNMICLDNKLHFSWAQGLWTFKYLGQEEGDIKGQTKVVLQFHSMAVPAKYNPLIPTDYVVWGPHARLHKRLQYNSPGSYNAKKGIEVCAGDLFRVSMESEEAPMFIRMIELRWVVINTVAMAGGAGRPELLATKDDYYGYGGGGGAEADDQRYDMMYAHDDYITTWLESIEPL